MRISASAPTRIDLAGGTIDIWPLYLFHDGAQTLNAAISLRARAWIETRPDERIDLRSEDTDKEANLSFDQLRNDQMLPLLARLTHRLRIGAIRNLMKGEGALALEEIAGLFDESARCLDAIAPERMLLGDCGGQERQRDRRHCRRTQTKQSIHVLWGPELMVSWKNTES